jgi:tetratricopeptide (TPR) repeat protein
MSDVEQYKPGLGRNQSLVNQLKEFQRNPRSLVFVALAESYRQQGLPNQALEIIEEGLPHHEGLASAILCRARCLYDVRRYADALNDTRSLLASNPNNVRAYKLEAEIYVRLGQRKAAMRALTRVVSLFPQDVEAIRALEQLENLELKQKIPTQRISRASLDTAPSQGKIEEFQVGNFSESLAAINNEVDQHVEIEESQDHELEEPTFATRTIAELYLRQGLEGKARKVLRKLLREDPRNAWAREVLQELESDGIVLSASNKNVTRLDAALQKKAKFLERLLAQVRLLNKAGA